MTSMKPGLQHLLPTALFLAATACGGGGGGSIAFEDLADEVGENLCSDAVECGLYPTKQACLDSFGFDLGQLEADLAAGLIEYDGSKARECLNASTVSICNLFDDGGDEQEPAACDETFTGSIALGGSCFSDEVCAGDAECDGAQTEDGCTAGTCVAVVPDPVLGESCANDSCADNLRCNEQQVCEAKGSAGATCTGFNGCASGLICEFGQDQAGTCVALAATGAACNPEIGGGFISACLSPNDFCDAADSTCKNRLAIGVSCSGETLTRACVRYAECIEGSCVANLLLGEACVVDGAGPDCIGGLECNGSVCAADAPDPVCTL